MKRRLFLKTAGVLDAVQSFSLPQISVRRAALRFQNLF
jgi:hypothetical protein